jgi:hypothetical protein
VCLATAHECLPPIFGLAAAPLPDPKGVRFVLVSTSSSLLRSRGDSCAASTPVPAWIFSGSVFPLEFGLAPANFLTQVLQSALRLHFFRRPCGSFGLAFLLFFPRAQSALSISVSHTLHFAFVLKSVSQVPQRVATASILRPASSLELAQYTRLILPA